MRNVFVCCTYKTDGNVINIDGNMINIDGSETGVSAQSPIGHRQTIGITLLGLNAKTNFQDITRFKMKFLLYALLCLLVLFILFYNLF